MKNIFMIINTLEYNYSWELMSNAIFPVEKKIIFTFFNSITLIPLALPSAERNVVGREGVPTVKSRFSQIAAGRANYS